MKNLETWLTNKVIVNLQILFFANMALVLFVLPLGGYAWVEKWKMLLWAPLILASGLIFLKNKISRQSLLYFFLFASSILIASLVRQERPVELNLLLSLMFFILTFSNKESLQLNKKSVYFIGLVSLASFVYQLITYRFQETRPTLSIGDPNYSGLLILLYFFFAWKTKFWPGIIFSIAVSFVLLSRNYFLALIIFFFSEFFLKRISLLTRKLDPLALSFISILALWLVGTMYLNFFNHSTEAPETVQRLFHFQDDSNYKRFQINKIFFSSLGESKIQTFFGVGSQYLNVVLKKFEIVLHNSFLELLARSGFFVFIFFFVLLKRGFKALWSQQNIAIWFSYFFFASFLHSAFEAKYLIFFLAVLLIDTSSNRANSVKVTGATN